MSKIKEAVERLERNLNTFNLNVSATKGEPAESFWGGKSEATRDVLAILRPLSEEPLQGLRDDVQAVLKKLPHARCHNLEIPEGCGGQCRGADEECAKCLLQSALIKHRTEEPVCRTCGGSRQKRRIDEQYGGEQNYTNEPCPDCRPEMTEFTKDLRSIASSFKGSQKQHNEYDLKVLKACDIIDHQAQTIKDQAAEIKDVIKFKDEIIKALNKRLSDLGAQC